MTEPMIRVRGARVHNLRDLDLDIPLNRLVVLTGVSGSGKSTLAFDTLFAEGRRRYLEGLSSHARQFLDQMERPDVDLIEGLPPTVAIDQKAGAASRRATVATMTEIHDYLRLLFARVGVPHCPRCGDPIRRQSPERIVSSALALPEGTKLILLAPLVRGKKGEHAEAFEAIRRAGLIRARVDGETVEIQDAPKLAKTKAHDIEAVVDRLVIREGIRPRLAESVDLALKLGNGGVVLSIQEGGNWVDRRVSIHYACLNCSVSLEEVEPRTFSFNSPYGACPACSGLGITRGFDPELVAPDSTRSIETGAIAAWGVLKKQARAAAEADPGIDRILKKKRKKRSTPLADLTPADRELLLRGDGDWPGILGVLESIYEQANDATKSALEAFRVASTCASCEGARLRPEARSVRLGGTTIDGLCARSIEEARRFAESLKVDPEWKVVADPILSEVRERLGFLDRVGVGYLTLDRSADTLSGGELQRVRLASRIGSGLVGVCYLLDEPTAGLHPSDTERLVRTLTDLRDQGNSVIVVEHDESVMRASEWMIDLGPGAGSEGGRVVAQGSTAEFIRGADSATARHLRAERTVDSYPKSDRLSRSPGEITIKNASEHNLKGIDVAIPLGTLVCVTGVSGSGKSTLVHDLLAPAARRLLHASGPRPGRVGEILGLEAFDKLIEVDQSPIGKGARSTPATYTGVFDDLRALYAATREAKVRGYGRARFSFNAPAGRCETCLGLGIRRIEMGFLPEIQIRCEACGGLRYNRSVLEIKYKGISIGEALRMRVDAALEHFENVPRVRRGLAALHEAGLGYVTLGQSASTLSGGEAQRVKLAAELGKADTGRTLYILDEPTTGLHFSDVDRLLTLLLGLAEKGNTLVVIEHNLDVVRRADWVIDLGPGGGEHGGTVLAAGPPSLVASVPQSLTGRWI